MGSKRNEVEVLDVNAVVGNHTKAPATVEI